jgi:aerobic-type carbon monoxide dehydrogenase small subunit (CoxS/CutS family)
MPSDDRKSGITRRELFRGIGGGALLGGIVPASALLGGEAARGEAAAGRVLGPDAVRITLRINGVERAVEVEPRVTLLSLLRDRLDLTGAKPACDRGACGACTVHLDGAPVMSCMLLAVDAVGREVRTVEGLAAGDALAPIQHAFVEHDALQCGFCTPGMVMSCQALLDRNPSPTLSDVKHAVAGNLCRCGTYPKVFEATLAAAAVARGGDHD